MSQIIFQKTAITEVKMLDLLGKIMFLREKAVLPQCRNTSTVICINTAWGK